MSDSHSYPHEPTGVETRKLGFWIFLSTEILFFGTLITTFMIFKGRDFPGIKLTDVYDIPFTSVSSFVLLMSSLTMVLAHNALENNDQEKLGFGYYLLPCWVQFFLQVKFMNLLNFIIRDLSYLQIFLVLHFMF